MLKRAAYQIQISATIRCLTRYFMLALVVMITATTYLNSKPDQVEKTTLAELSLEEKATENCNETDLTILPFETQNQSKEMIKTALKNTALPYLPLAEPNHPGTEVPPPEAKTV